MGIDIGIYTTDFKNEFISLTDIAKYKSIQPSITIHNWLRGRDVVEFLGLWERLHNPDFKLIEFDKFKKDAGSNAYVFSKDNLIPPELTPEQISYKYANEADLLNVALFGKTAKQWRDSNPGKKGNMRDEANLNQLLVLANMESYNAILIEQEKLMSERLILLREFAIKQMKTLAMVSMDGLKQLPGGDSQ